MDTRHIHCLLTVLTIDDIELDILALEEGLKVAVQRV
jgi:hypothetical protein